MGATHRDRGHTAGIQRQSCLSGAIVTPRIKVGIRGREPLHHRIGGIHRLEAIPPGSRAHNFSAADGPHIEPLIEKHPPGASRRRIIGKQQSVVAASDAIDLPAGQADGGIVRGDEPIPDRKQLAVGQGTMADLNRRVHTVCRKGDPMKRLQAPGILGQNLDLHIAEIHRPIGGGIPRKPEGCVSRTVQPEVRARPLHKRAQLHNAAEIVQTVQESQRRRLHGRVIGIDNLVVDVHERSASPLRAAEQERLRQGIIDRLVFGLVAALQNHQALVSAAAVRQIQPSAKVTGQAVRIAEALGDAACRSKTIVIDEANRDARPTGNQTVGQQG